MAAPDQYGAQVAADILKKGGNAVDAAVATAFTLAVTYPEAGNIGGGGFMTLFVDGKPYFLDYREVAPKAASRNMYLDEKARSSRTSAWSEPEPLVCRYGDGALGGPQEVRQAARSELLTPPSAMPRTVSRSPRSSTSTATMPKACSRPPPTSTTTSAT